MFEIGRDWQVRLRLVREGFRRVASMVEIGRVWQVRLWSAKVLNVWQVRLRLVLEAFVRV